jgi:hypothetical protein
MKQTGVEKRYDARVLLEIAKIVDKYHLHEAMNLHFRWWLWNMDRSAVDQYQDLLQVAILMDQKVAVKELSYHLVMDVSTSYWHYYVHHSAYGSAAKYAMHNEIIGAHIRRA